MYCNRTKLYGFPRCKYLAFGYLSPQSYDCIVCSSFLSFSMQHKHGPSSRQLARNLDTLSQDCLHHVSQISWRVHLSNVETCISTDHPPLSTHMCHLYHHSVTMHVPICPWTTVKSLGPVCPLWEGTKTHLAPTTEYDLAPLNIGLATAYH